MSKFDNFMLVVFILYAGGAIVIGAFCDTGEAWAIYALVGLVLLGVYLAGAIWTALMWLRDWRNEVRRR